MSWIHTGLDDRGIDIELLSPEECLDCHYAALDLELSLAEAIEDAALKARAYDLVEPDLDDDPPIFEVLDDDGEPIESLTVGGEESEELQGDEAEGSTPEEADNVFRRVGDVWRVRFMGSEAVQLKDVKGMRLVAFLLSNPGSGISC